MSDSKKTLYLLDAMALAYRAHFIFISRPLVNSKGQNTSATYGFIAALLKLIEDNDIRHMVVVFDAPGEGGTFRDELYPDYKAHRDPPPDDLISNLPRIKAVVRAMDVPVVEVAGVEADDVIGTLARKAENDGANVVIVSPDKDFQQLLSERISIFRPAYRGESFDPITVESFREKYALEPEQFIDVLALMGDSADNVPGVRGIGEKTALKLLQEYGSVENVLDHAADIKGKRAREGLLEHAEDARMSKVLVTILTSLELGLDWSDFFRSQPDVPQLGELFRELEFTGLYRRVLKVAGEPVSLPPGSQSDLFGGSAERDAATSTSVEAPTATDPPTSSIVSSTPPSALSTTSLQQAYDPEKVTYRLITNLSEAEQVVGALMSCKELAFDTETTSVDPMMASLVGVSLSAIEGEAYYFPTPMLDGASTTTVLDILRPLLEGEIPKIGQNIKYDLLVLARHGIVVGGRLMDTMVVHYLIAPEESHGMDAMALRYLDYRPIPISDLIGKGKQQKSMRDIPPIEVAPYASEDADITLRLWHLFEPMLDKRGVADLAWNIELPLIRVLARMETAGISLDVNTLSQLSVSMAAELEDLEKRIYEQAEETFNIASTQQLGKILFEKLGLPVISRTSKGQASTRESVLRELATEHSLPAIILDWRELAKLKSTYVDTLGELVHPESERVHTSYSQTTAATGRLSSSNPNMQNIPVRSARGREIRKAFVAPRGSVLMSADYAQIELRILASVSEDEALKNAFNRGDDVHASTAARVFNIEQSEVTREQRSKAKEVNFGIPYGISAFGLAQRLRCPVAEARTLIEGYQKSYPGVTRYLADQVEFAREKGYVETLLGRRRYVPDIHARNRNVRSFAERVAVNMPIQGSQADMIKIAMVAVDRRIRKEGLRSKMLLQVHDELVLEVPENEIDGIRTLVEEEMRDALPLSVPVEVEINTGHNWLDAH